MTTPDPVDQIPPPDTVRELLADSIRRSDLLRSLLRVSRRKAAYTTKATPADLITEAVRRGLPLTTADRLGEVARG